MSKGPSDNAAINAMDAMTSDNKPMPKNIRFFFELNPESRVFDPSGCEESGIKTPPSFGGVSSSSFLSALRMELMIKFLQNFMSKSAARVYWFSFGMFRDDFSL